MNDIAAAAHRERVNPRDREVPHWLRGDPEGIAEYRGRRSIQLADGFACPEVARLYPTAVRC